MGRTACTEPQCLYKGALYLTFYTYQKSQAENTISICNLMSVFPNITINWRELLQL
jgi:hypothetical protein